MTTEKDLYDEDTGELLLSKTQLETVRIDEMDLDNEFMNLARNLAYWNARYAEANRCFLLERHELRVTEAGLRLEMREAHKDDKPKATNDDIVAYIHEHEDYISAHLRYIEADADALKFKKFAEAISAKKDMLQSLGAKLRAEWDGDTTTRGTHRSDRQDRQDGT